MTKRGNHEDSIYKDGDRWRGAISVGYSENGRRVRKKVTGRTRTEVVEKLRRARRSVDEGMVPDDKITMNRLFERWLAENLPGSVAESTEDDYNDTVRLHLAPALGRKKLANLTVSDVDRLWKAKREAGYSPNSIRIMRTVLRKALGQAEREGIISRNVAALSAPPHVVAKEGRTLTLHQAKALLAEVTGHRFEVAVMIALAYGTRRGEVLGLRWSALSWETGTVRITHAVKRVKNRDRTSTRKTRLAISEVKTPKSRRTLVLTPQILVKLRSLHAHQARRKIAAGEERKDHDLIFANKGGTPLDPDNFGRFFSRLTQRAGLGHWHPHELRHSGASLMLAQGTPLHVVSEVLGHASISITKDVYGHLLIEDKRTAAETMTRALFGA